jgi:hypothetical protein
MSAKRITQSGQYGPPSDNHELSHIAQYNADQAYDNYAFVSVSFFRQIESIC